MLLRRQVFLRGRLDGRRLLDWYARSRLFAWLRLYSSQKSTTRALSIAPATAAAALGSASATLASQAKAANMVRIPRVSSSDLVLGAQSNNATPSAR